MLVDKDGVPVARCRCGNPLLEPIFIKEADCFGCPPNYRPPPPCEYYDYDDRDYDRYGDALLEARLRAQRLRRRLLPALSGSADDPRRAGPRTTATPKPAQPEQVVRPSGGVLLAVERHGQADTYTLYASGFRPGVTLSRAAGAARRRGRELQHHHRAAAAAARTRSRTRRTRSLGTYTATITDSGTGDSATASTTVSAAPQAAPPTDQLQCDPPRSAARVRAMRGARGQRAAEHAGARRPAPMRPAALPARGRAVRGTRLAPAARTLANTA